MSPPASVAHNQQAARPQHADQAKQADRALVEHLPRLRRLAVRMLGCSHLADDAIQEALVALWQMQERPTHADKWLIRAVIHRCKHLRRTAQRRNHHEHVASQHCELHKGCDNPLHVAIAHETGERLHQVLDTLPTGQRDALILFEQKDLGYKGVAEQLNLPIGTVRSRLARARATVNAAMDRHANTE